MTRLKYLRGRNRLIPEFQRKWDDRLKVQWIDRWMFNRLTPQLEQLLQEQKGPWLYRRLYRRLVWEKPPPIRQEWRGLTTEIVAADDAMLSAYSGMLLIVAVFALLLLAVYQAGK